MSAFRFVVAVAHDPDPNGSSHLLPSDGLVARDEQLKPDPATAGKFVPATLMGFLFMRENHPGTIKIMSRMLRIEDASAAKLYDASRPTMTADGAVTGDTEKKMTGFVLKTVGAKEALPADKLYDFALVKKAPLALQGKGWQPSS